MKKMIILARFTFAEILAQPVYRSLCLLACFFVLAAHVLSNLFLFETGKVLVDLIWLGMGSISFIYALFVACTMLAQDIGHKMLYLFIPQTSRSEYLTGRLLGITLALILLAFVMFLLSFLAVYWNIVSTSSPYHHGLNYLTVATLALVSVLQSLVYIALVAFVCAWATSQAEMLVFSTAFIVFSALFPSVVAILESPEVIKNTPDFIAGIIHMVSFLFPRISASDFAIAQAHGIHIPVTDWFAFIAAYFGYVIAILAATYMIFSKRSL